MPARQAAPTNGHAQSPRSRDSARLGPAVFFGRIGDCRQGNGGRRARECSARGERPQPGLDAGRESLRAAPRPARHECVAPGLPRRPGAGERSRFPREDTHADRGSDQPARAGSADRCDRLLVRFPLADRAERRLPGGSEVPATAQADRLADRRHLPLPARAHQEPGHRGRGQQLVLSKEPSPQSVEVPSAG